MKRQITQKVGGTAQCENRDQQKWKPKNQFRFLAKNSKIGVAQDNFILNLRKFSHKKYIIFYFEIENGVEIYRVVHGARNIEAVFEDFFEGLKP